MEFSNAWAPHFERGREFNPIVDPELQGITRIFSILDWGRDADRRKWGCTFSEPPKDAFPRSGPHLKAVAPVTRRKFKLLYISRAKLNDMYYVQK
jgi:hypothetical protein